MRIGVFCSGGDAPGMNACVRAVVRSACGAGAEVVGICRGYQGLLDEEFFLDEDGTSRMSPRCVANLIQRGGTILQSSRSSQFRTDEGLRQAADVLTRHGIDALVAIGGDGTFRGAVELARHWNGQIVGCPGTIDNDLVGTDFTIGFATAVETATGAVDKLRDTAESHERLVLVEVMGRHSGYIALYTALAAAAEAVCVPETANDVAKMVDYFQRLRLRRRHSVIVVVAEGDESGGAANLRRELESAGCPYEIRTVILGYVQRGGSPVTADRLLASRLGEFAVRSILDGATGVMAGQQGWNLVLTPFEEAVAGHKPLPQELLELLDRLSV
jgi:6-phosphofructokinase 1